MSRPAPQVPFERRRPVPPLNSVDEVKRAVEYPYVIRVFVTMMAVGAVYLLMVIAYAVVTRGHQNMVVFTVLAAVWFVFLFGGTKIMPAMLMRRFYDRVMRGGVLCDVYPAGFPDTKTAILIDARLSDAQAAYVHDATVSWLGRLAADPAARAQAGDLFSDGRIRSADEFAGPGARGGFLVAEDKDPNQGWRLILPEPSPRDPHRPYANGLVVQVKTPSLESAGQ
ncbi:MULTISPECIES: hypothetical protein [Mycolicibacterium]|uniref:Uncharacterized protein n=1 Tax=Mycolicibacterium farcinogenes TaxID=1802 RepID=A0ACD1FB32_MYCFR|nr:MULTISPECIES: hypothetical protein [Mycolicibacterium]QZH64245.1 hypothetical protein K6L26_19585 [Mycolicibacterium farcinogenes]